MSLICCKRKKKITDTEAGLREVRNRSVRGRDWETRNKFRCLFCGRKSCKHEDWTTHKAPAIRGLNSDWITDNILATQRLSSRIIEEFELFKQFREVNLTSVFNLQIPGEHPYCGDGLLQNRAFTYTPEELYAAGMYFYNMGWPDMHVPTINMMANLVQMMSLPIERGEKIAVHCHAGYGRTGLAIACFLLYSTELTAEKSISLVRSKRPKCIQTSKQQKFVFEFYEFLKKNREIFCDTKCSATEYFYRQTVLIHGNALKTIDSIPKLVYEVGKLIENRLANGVYLPEQVSCAFYDVERPVFSSPTYLSLLGVTQVNEFVISIDETAMNSPAVTLIEQMEAKIRTYKHSLNLWTWDDYLLEKDVRVHIQILLEWLEKQLSEPIIFSNENLLFLERCIELQEFKHTSADKDLMPKVNFKIVQKLVNSILYPLFGKKDFLLVINRIVICLLGLKQKWIEYFEGRKMKKIVFSNEIDWESRLSKVLFTWCEMNLKMTN